MVITARKRSCGKVMFLHLSVSHSVQGCILAYNWQGCTPTSEQTTPPPQADTPIPLSRPPQADPLETATEAGHIISYWNEFLCLSIVSWVWRVIGSVVMSFLFPRRQWASQNKFCQRRTWAKRKMQVIRRPDVEPPKMNTYFCWPVCL